MASQSSTEIDQLRAQLAERDQRIRALEHELSDMRLPPVLRGLPTDAEATRLVAILAARHPVFAGLDVQALRIGIAYVRTLYTAAALNARVDFSYWTDKCNGWCRAHGLSTDPPPSVLAAAIVLGVPYQIGDRSRGRMSYIGLLEWPSDRSSPIAADAWRGLLRGERGLRELTLAPPPNARIERPLTAFYDPITGREVRSTWG